MQAKIMTEVVSGHLIKLIIIIRSYSYFSLPIIMNVMEIESPIISFCPNFVTGMYCVV